MKILFLDHDGVICLQSEWGSRFKNKEGLDGTFDRFNQKAIDVLNEIIEATDCEIVTSSDWRLHASLEEMQHLFILRNVLKPPIDFTGHIKSSVQDLELARSREILEWVDSHNITSWCAVDDLDMSNWLTDRFVRTPRSREGIKQSGVKEKIIKILNQSI
jgi:hypothetical protein